MGRGNFSAWAADTSLPFFFDRATQVLNVAVSRAKDSFLVFGRGDLQGEAGLQAALGAPGQIPVPVNGACPGGLGAASALQRLQGTAGAGRAHCQPRRAPHGPGGQPRASTAAARDGLVLDQGGCPEVGRPAHPDLEGDGDWHRRAGLHGPGFSTQSPGGGRATLSRPPLRRLQSSWRPPVPKSAGPGTSTTRTSWWMTAPWCSGASTGSVPAATSPTATTASTARSVSRARGSTSPRFGNRSTLSTPPSVAKDHHQQVPAEPLHTRNWPRTGDEMNFTFDKNKTALIIMDSFYFQVVVY